MGKGNVFEDGVDQHGLAASGPGFYEGLQTFLSVTQPLCIAAGEKGDVPCAGTPGEARRHVIPATYSADLAWRGVAWQGGVIDAARLQGKRAAPQSIWVATPNSIPHPSLSPSPSPNPIRVKMTAMMAMMKATKTMTVTTAMATTTTATTIATLEMGMKATKMRARMRKTMTTMRTMTMTTMMTTESACRV